MNHSNYEDTSAFLQEIEELKQRNAELELQYKACAKALKRAEDKAARQEEYLHFVEENYNLVINSKGHRLLESYYKLREMIRPANLKNSVKQLFPRSSILATLSEDALYEKLRSCSRIDIVAVPHTAFVARLLQGILLDAGIDSQIHLSQPETYEDIPYIMVCPQNFDQFPALYIAFQMEQTVSRRWLTDRYLDILRNAYAVFDYSPININYFSEDPAIAPKLFYMPIDFCGRLAEMHAGSTEKEYDVLFYGAVNDRRKRYLDRIGESCRLKIITDKFGDELYAEMKKAKLIVNIHFYENALLETTRLYEILSVCDSLIISECSTDPLEDERLEGLVDFVDVDDVDGMLKRIAFHLSDDHIREQTSARIHSTLSERVPAATYYLNRFLLANDRITFDRFYETASGYIHFQGNRICLSLPETPERRASFDRDNIYGFEVFPGLKHRLGWIGCGMSYKFLFRKALEQNLDSVLICEDDVFFPADFKERFEHILQYCESHKDWNIFSGIMAEMGDASILDYIMQDDEEFVYLNRMMSMVFNLYDRSVFSLISDWDNTLWDKQTNTIDRYLEDKIHRVLTTCPFLVGHKEDLSSTIWNHKNDLYNPGIENCSKKLRLLLDDYLYKEKQS